MNDSHKLNTMKIVNSEDIVEMEGQPDEVLRRMAYSCTEISIPEQQCNMNVARQLQRFIQFAQTLCIINLHDCFKETINVRIILIALESNRVLKVSVGNGWLE